MLWWTPECPSFCRTRYYSKVYAWQTGNVPVCDPKKYYRCVHVAQLNYVKDNEAAKCNCPRQCHTLTYQPTISQAQLAPSAAAYMKNAFQLNTTVNDLILDYCMVEVSKPMNFDVTVNVNVNSYSTLSQWRRQLWGTGARVLLDFQQFHF